MMYNIPIAVIRWQIYKFTFYDNSNVCALSRARQLPNIL